MAALGIVTRVDYDTRTDSNPVLIGTAEDGTPTSAASWAVQMVTYDSSGLAVRVEAVDGVAWDDRAASF